MPHANAANGQNGHSEAAAGDRLSKFTEYRGEDMMMPHAQDINQEPRRPTQTDLERERVRGQSLPPGATIENIRDFYKSSQYKSMYQLPPSPTRPAPVLERGSRTTRLSPSAGPRVSISEGDVTDESSRPPNGVQQQGPPEKMPRHHRRPVSTSALRPSSSKRQAPSPPVAPSTGKGLVVRRVVSSDGRASSASGVSRNVPMPQAINSNVQKAPSMRRIVVGTRRSSVDNGLDSSFSESEGPFNGETEQDKQPLGEFGRRWTAATPHSHLDSDYRRDLASSSTGLHQEARSRDGGQVTSSWTGGRLSRGSSKNNVREEADIILRSTTDLERSNSNSAREEERRKVLEIEGVIRQPQTQLRANVTRSASRASQRLKSITPARAAISRACLVTCQLMLTGSLSIQVIQAVKQCHYPDRPDPSLTGLTSIALAWAGCAGQQAMLMLQPWVVLDNKFNNGKQNCQVDHLLLQSTAQNLSKVVMQVNR